MLYYQIYIMTKNRPGETEFCAENKNLSYIVDSQNSTQVQITQTYVEQADSSVTLKVENEPDVDAPINLVKGKRCEDSLPELTRSLVKYPDGNHPSVSSHSIHGNTLQGDDDLTIGLVQKNVTESLPSKTADVHINTEMKQVQGGYESLQTKCPKLSEEELQSDCNNIGQQVSLNPATNLGGMLAKQLVSPLRCNLNSRPAEAELRKNFGEIGRKENPMYLLPTSAKVSSITVPSPLLSSAANVPSTSQSRSHTTINETSPNQSPCSASTVDLATATRVVISAAIRNASAVLEEEEHSNANSNIIVISDQQTRNVETAGNNVQLRFKKMRKRGLIF